VSANKGKRPGNTRKRHLIDRVVLIGFRGAGKTTVARALAQRLRWTYVSTDARIEEIINRPIARYVKEKGWPAFRAVERDVLQEVAGKNQVVLDCGGGVVEDPGNMNRLLPHALIVWVDARLEDIIQRLESSGDRPLLTHPDLSRDVQINYHRRRPLYARYSHLRVDTSAQSVETAVEQILAHLQGTDKSHFR